MAVEIEIVSRTRPTVMVHDQEPVAAAAGRTRASDGRAMDYMSVAPAFKRPVMLGSLAGLILSFICVPQSRRVVDALGMPMACGMTSRD